MNKRVLAIIIIIVAALIAGSIAAAALMNIPAAPVATAPSPTVADEETDEEPEVLPGAYLAYSPDAVPAASGRTFLFFYAPWCGQCRDIDAGILAQGVPDGVTIFKVDFDTEQALEQQYGVTMRTTFLEIDEGGTELQRFVAYDTPTFDAVIAAMF